MAFFLLFIISGDCSDKPIQFWLVERSKFNPPFFASTDSTFAKPIIGPFTPNDF